MQSNECEGGGHVIAISIPVSAWVLATVGALLLLVAYAWRTR